MGTLLTYLGLRSGRRPELPGPSRITRLDQAVEARVAPRRSRSLDRVFYPLSTAADHGLLWIAIGALRAAAVPRHRRAFLRLVAAITTESALTNGLVKSLFRRVRPADPLAGLPLPYGMRRPITSAFPSGHAASAFTAAALLAEDDNLAPAYYSLAGLVAVSRVYVRMHHTSDVLAGTAWGLAFGRAVRRRYPLPQAGRRDEVSISRMPEAQDARGAARPAGRSRRGGAGRWSPGASTRPSGTV